MHLISEMKKTDDPKNGSLHTSNEIYYWLLEYDTKERTQIWFISQWRGFVKAQLQINMNISDDILLETISTELREIGEAAVKWMYNDGSIFHFLKKTDFPKGLPDKKQSLRFVQFLLLKRLSTDEAVRLPAL